MTGPKPQIVWFKRDLRLADHAPLVQAAALGPVVAIHVVEPELWRQPDASGRQWAFVAETLAELSSAIDAIGGQLLVRVGDAVAVLSALVEETGADAIWSHEETGNSWTYQRDLAVQAWAGGAGVAWHEMPQTGVIRRIRTRVGWARAWDRRMAEPVLDAPLRLHMVTGQLASHPLPTGHALGLADDPCPGRQPGGRRAGLERLESFLIQRGRTYRTAMSSPLGGETACSRISPYLAHGAISLREVNHRLKSAQMQAPDRVWAGSLSSFDARLHWHCHFMQKLEDEPALEWRELHSACRGLRPIPGDPARLAAWASGTTGWPFVDACMRSLIATGWLNFRMRAMVMAVASYHLWLPWQETGQVLARLFTDYEAGIHWPQVQMQSGVTGINTVRIYNPVKQGHDQDPDGAFVRRWLPELAAVPDAFIQEPWLWPGAGTLAYPPPITDHLAAARAARDAVWGLRKTGAFASEARTIQNQHGSRKSGVRGGQNRARAPRKLAAGVDAQLDLFAATFSPDGQ
ncbi:MAG: deoxyribodipyrimidine photo-lyase [Hyphomonadaceae bacterium]|nr:deoxyribodipyrimidine photo-lyase [Hyphomonadaceae bacterium]